MELFHQFFRLLAFSQGLFLCVYLLIYQRNKTGLLFFAVALSASSYLIVPLVYRHFGLGPLEMILAGMATAFPALLWLLASRFFNDELRFPPLFVVAASGYMTLWFIDALAVFPFSDAELNNALFNLLPQLIKLSLVLHVVYIALAGRQHDLVARRLRLRVPVATVCGSVAALVIVIELWAAGSVPLFIEFSGALLLFLIFIGANIWMFRLREDLPLALADSSRQKRETESLDQEIIERIERLMSEQRFYAQHSVTIADLAEQLRLPAYRLRQLINQHMGYQNFNQFLNRYRIEEASRRIREEKSLAILSIALDVGFKSMSSFNQAFKAAHNLTPTAYRDSAPSH